MQEGVEAIHGLVRGEPGPFMETETEFFGKKRVDPSMKDAKMETDCGGMIITKAPITYGEADAIAASVNLYDLMRFLRKCEKPSCYWRSEFPQGKKNPIWLGEFWWAIYSYLVAAGWISGNPLSYNNSMEYLYDLVLKRLETDGFFEADPERRYFVFKG